MRDYLGNDFEVGTTVIMAIKSGRTAGLGRAYVRNHELRPQYAGGLQTNMIEVEWSNLHRYWIPASKVVAIPDEMLPEKRREKLNETEEAIQPS